MIGLLIPGTLLDPAAREHALQLVRALRWAPLSAVYCSQLEPAVETAQPLARDHGLDVQVRPGLTDADRIVGELVALAKTHQDEMVALVSDPGPIRHALATLNGTGAGEPLDVFPGHVSAIGITAGVMRVLGINVPVDEMTV